jgi:hypothetical protein
MWGATSAKINSLGSTGHPQACVSSGQGYGAQEEYSPDMKYFSMVAMRTNGSWGYVRVNAHCLDLIGDPVVFHESFAQELLEIWKRVVLDDAIPWEDHVVPNSLRIIRINTTIEDKTFALFHDDAEVRDFLKMSAVSKLSDAESRLLGLTNLKAKQRLIHNPDLHRDDTRVMTQLSKNSGTMTLTGHINYLKQ